MDDPIPDDVLNLLRALIHKAGGKLVVKREDILNADGTYFSVYTNLDGDIEITCS